MIVRSAFAVSRVVPMSTEYSGGTGLPAKDGSGVVPPSVGFPFIVLS